MSIQGFDDRLARERRGRLQAERLLAQRSEELYSAHRKLAEHAHALSHTVIEQRAVNADLIGRSTQAQAALAVATEKAVVAERRLWDALSAVEGGFAMFDRDWRLVIANPAWMRAFEGVADVAPGASYEAILRVAVEEGLVDLQGATPEAWVTRMIARWRLPNIPPVDIRLFNGIHIRVIDKRTPEGDLVSLAVDITDTIRRERDLERARDAAEAAARAKSAFLANMSHEIRTPMNGVVSMAELLRETALTEEQALYADTIRNSGEALLVIINDILDYSKIDARKLVLHPERFDLRQTILEIFQLMRPGLEGKALDLRLKDDPRVPDSLIGDRGRIRQILTNLIGNAVKFTQAGHVTVRVRAAPPPHPPDRMPIRVTVEDTGIGIAPDMQRHVFGEFNQIESEATRRFDGTGLGLAITQKLVSLMEGEIWLESELGKGSLFGFAITLGIDPQAVTEPVPPAPRPARLRVLAAEDNKTNQLVFRSMLKGVDLDLDLVENGALCVAAYRRGVPDMIFTDISMPEMDGTEAAQAIRAMEAELGRPPVPIIAMTAHAMDGDRGRILAAGIDAYMTKPLKKADLHGMIRAHAPAALGEIGGLTAASSPAPE
ncbi:ATP-binding protein [Roseicyclus marinus]|uniref:ATP-binding protein n=1 Tax=Roseicyclus marinus TaxID=2161673 RepID=UPI00240F9905|nr:ATP-binding protein [Roseicyclus marinus]MDG3041527.1 ATP-binding protein [Roseicyclus marinus]